MKRATFAFTLLCLCCQRGYSQTATPNPKPKSAVKLPAADIQKPDLSDVPNENDFNVYEDYKKAIDNWMAEARLAAGGHLPPVGRYQIITSSLAVKNTFLLDSITGSTWIICESKDLGTQWCSVPRTSFAAK